jgi:hypothetical protein
MHTFSISQAIYIALQVGAVSVLAAPPAETPRDSGAVLMFKFWAQLDEAAKSYTRRPPGPEPEYTLPKGIDKSLKFDGRELGDIYGIPDSDKMTNVQWGDPLSFPPQGHESGLKFYGPRLVMPVTLSDGEDITDNFYIPDGKSDQDFESTSPTRVPSYKEFVGPGGRLHFGNGKRQRKWGTSVLTHITTVTTLGRTSTIKFSVFPPVMAMQFTIPDSGSPDRKLLHYLFFPKDTPSSASQLPLRRSTTRIRAGQVDEAPTVPSISPR